MVSAGSIARWNSLRRLKLKSTARKADSAAKNERRQKFGSQFVLEFEREWVCSASRWVLSWPDFCLAAYETIRM